MNKHILDPKIVEAASKAVEPLIVRFVAEGAVRFKKAFLATAAEQDKIFVDQLVADFSKAARASIETSCASLRPDLSPRGPERTPGL